MVQDAEENNQGEPIYKREIEVAEGATKTVEVNVRRVFRPGDRRTGSHDLLRTEARMAADGVELGNPAKPINGEVAEKHVEWCEKEGLQPAWEVCERREWSL